MNINPTAGGSSSSAPPPPWIELPRDLTVNILRRLGPEEILDSAERVCTTWRSVCREPSFWRVVHMDYSEELRCPRAQDRADSLCCYAVDRSQGELIEISIRNFGSNDLLRYIYKRSCHLKILSISCSNIFHQRLTTAVKNLPLLEELHLVYMPSLSSQDIKIIGLSCPMLKSFTLKCCHLRLRLGNVDKRAQSIGKYMPNLLRLCLFGDGLRNQGLLAILDGCPKLESLDLRGCYNVDLRSDLEIRCSEQIKELRRLAGHGMSHE